MYTARNTTQGHISEFTHEVHTYNTYILLNSSNKRACSNTFVHVTLVSSTHNNGQKLQENVKSDTRKLLKHLKNNLKMKKTHKTRTHSC